MWIVTPIKHFNSSKQRLADTLNLEQRHLLCQVMLEDVLSTICSLSNIEGVTLVSGALQAGRLAKQFGVHFQPENTLQASGLNGVLQVTVNMLAAKGKKGLMLLHADLPLITPGTRLLYVFAGPAEIM
jgi:2-phospho-L-lactate guanylyltransferase (CobY/MobA/RfbA family)